MRTKTYSGGGDIQIKIDKLQKLIDNPEVNESDKRNYREAVRQFKEKLTPEKKAEEKPKTPEKKAEEKPVVKKTASKISKLRKPVAKKTTSTNINDKKLPKGVQMLSKKKVVVEGKEMDVDSKEFCDYLTVEFIKRKEQAKNKKETRKKTKSVMAIVSDKIEQGVQKAIKTGISKQKPTLKKNPQVFIGKVQKLETATKNFLQQLKEVLGNDYEAKEVADTTKAIHQMIEDLKKKYAKK
jgi:hypothetical protein